MATTNSLQVVSEKKRQATSQTKRTHLLMNVTSWVSALTQIDSVTASMKAEKDLRKNILRRKGGN